MRLNNNESSHVFFNKVSQRITGSEGFRTLSAPVSGPVFDDLLSDFWTQGFTGSDGPSASAVNVWVWDETLDTGGGWTGLKDQNNDNLDAGQGFLFYIYSDDDFDGTPEGFPKGLTNEGVLYGGNLTRNTGSVQAVSNLEDGRFFLSGNPYQQTIDWDMVTTSGLSNTVYVYDHASSSWRLWNGTSGDLTDGLIAPFQGFFVQGNGGNGSLTIEEADISPTDATFYKANSAKPLAVEFTLEKEDQANKTWLNFNEHAKSAFDPYDGLALQPLANSYLQLYTIGPENTNLNINAFPNAQDITIPLSMQLYEDGSSVESKGTLGWSGIDQLPDWYKISLVDTKTGQKIDLRERASIEVEIEEVVQNQEKDFKKRENISLAGNPPNPVPVAYKFKNENTRYKLEIRYSESGLDDELPTSVNLQQNYPNPFNPATMIEYDVPNRAEVTLEIYDMLGRKVATLFNGVRSAGTYEATFNAGKLASGLYMSRLTVGNTVLTKKMMLVK
ncbi:MAG: T9SS type A sorting domain-containing protein [Balneolaceae bacterium]|nr:T9SS type A sorting domain-containing protein [Balneolaceae bacterium]